MLKKFSLLFFLFAISLFFSAGIHKEYQNIMSGAYQADVTYILLSLAMCFMMIGTLCFMIKLVIELWKD